MTDKKTEALKLALEALRKAHPISNSDKDLYKHSDALTAIREALADEALDRMAENARELGLDYEQGRFDAQVETAQQQEPVAGLRCKVIENCKSCQHSVGRLSCSLADRDFDSLERSAVPPEWCPLPLYTSPPIEATPLASQSRSDVKPWVGLTKEERVDFTLSCGSYETVCSIEAKLKAKNSQ